MRNGDEQTNHTILLVEDHEDTRRAVAAWLRRKDYTVVEAKNKRTCLELAKSISFDLLICDLQLPDGNGWDLLRELKAQHSFVAIATSGHGAPADYQKSRDAGFLIHITKPYPVEKMLSALATAKERLRGNGESARNANVPVHRSGPQAVGAAARTSETAQRNEKRRSALV